MAVEKILVDDKEVEIDTGDRLMTTLVPQPTMYVECPVRMKIGAEETIARVRDMSELEYNNYRELRLIKEVWPHFWRYHGEYAGTENTSDPIPEIPEYAERQRTGLDKRHLFGLLVLIIECVLAGRQPYLEYIETYLHPKQEQLVMQGLRKLAELACQGEPDGQSTVAG